ncbi:unnamed protein product, partial [Rotaria sp. Silwood2]
MLRFFFRYRSSKSKYIFIVFLFPFIIFIYIFSHQNLSENKIEISSNFLSSTVSSNIRSHDFRLYSESGSFIEYNHLQIDNIAQSMFFFNKNNDHEQKNTYTQPIEYSELKFRSTSIPIIWLDEYGDVHWN